MNSGAEAVETAVHIARSATGRQGVVVFDGAYHGRTNLTMAMTSKFSLFKKGFGPFAPEIYRFPFPNTYRRPAGMSVEDYVAWETSARSRFTAIVDPSHVAAIVVEPVQGEAGFVPAPRSVARRLRQLADEHGIVLIADEIQSGMGRTGTLWAIEHSGVVPDMITTAKSLGAACRSRRSWDGPELMDAPHPGGLGGTYSGNPLACVAAREAIDMISTPLPGTVGRDRRANAATAGGDPVGTSRPHRGRARPRFDARARDRQGSGDSKEPWMEATAAITAATLQRGVITIRAGLYSNCVRFLPPLVITDAELDEALDVVAASVAEVAGSMR
jgi:4-aminobutyrate aminotransferase / (S)-3-amino-2-methylpropionate transaminase / 5-aminovalerate transaminase